MYTFYSNYYMYLCVYNNWVIICVFMCIYINGVIIYAYF